MLGSFRIPVAVLGLAPGSGAFRVRGGRTERLAERRALTAKRTSVRMAPRYRPDRDLEVALRAGNLSWGDHRRQGRADRHRAADRSPAGVGSAPTTPRLSLRWSRACWRRYGSASVATAVNAVTSRPAGWNVLRSGPGPCADHAKDRVLGLGARTAPRRDDDRAGCTVTLGASTEVRRSRPHSHTLARST
jgi:hypothetical protein